MSNRSNRTQEKIERAISEGRITSYKTVENALSYRIHDDVLFIPTSWESFIAPMFENSEEFAEDPKTDDVEESVNDELADDLWKAFNEDIADLLQGDESDEETDEEDEHEDHYRENEDEN